MAAAGGVEAFFVGGLILASVGGDTEAVVTGSCRLTGRPAPAPRRPWQRAAGSRLGLAMPRRSEADRRWPIRARPDPSPRLRERREVHCFMREAHNRFGPPGRMPRQRRIRQDQVELPPSHAIGNGRVRLRAQALMGHADRRHQSNADENQHGRCDRRNDDANIRQHACEALAFNPRDAARRLPTAGQCFRAGSADFGEDRPLTSACEGYLRVASVGS